MGSVNSPSTGGRLKTRPRTPRTRSRTPRTRTRSRTQRTRSRTPGVEAAQMRLRYVPGPCLHTGPAHSRDQISRGCAHTSCARTRPYPVDCTDLTTRPTNPPRLVPAMRTSPGNCESSKRIPPGSSAGGVQLPDSTTPSPVTIPVGKCSHTCRPGVLSHRNLSARE